MKNSLSIGTFLVIILLSGSLFASGVALTGVGARATTLGGNFRAIADDWSAMYWNPAGLTQMSGMQFGVGVERIKPTVHCLPSEYLHPLHAVLDDVGVEKFSVLYYKKLEGTKYETVKNEDRTFYIPSLGFVYSTEKMSFGLGFWAPFGLGGKWDLLDTQNYNPNYPETDYDDDLKIIDIHPTFSYKVNDKLSVGMGVGIIIADIKIIKPNFTRNPVMGLLSLAQALPTINEAFIPTAQYINEQLGGEFAETNFVEPYDHLITEVSLEGNGTGFGFNFGVKYDVLEQLSVGITGRYYLDIDLDGDLKKDTYFAHMNDSTFSALIKVNEVLYNIHQSVPQQVLDGAGIDSTVELAMRGMYSGGHPENSEGINKFADDGAKATLPLPMEIGLGIAYKPNQNIIFSADFAWTQWSTWDVIEIELSDGSVNKLVQNWDDGIRLGCGLDYKMNALNLRAGVYSEPSPIPDETMDPTIPDINRRTGVSLGFSYYLGKIGVHGMYEYLFISDRNIGTLGWNYNEEENGYDNIAGEYKMDVYNFMLGFDYSF